MPAPPFKIDTVTRYTCAPAVELPEPWGYYDFSEATSEPWKVDKTGKLHDLLSINSPVRTTGQVSTYASQLTSASGFASVPETFDAIASPWAFWGWIYLVSPDASGLIFGWAGLYSKSVVQLQYLFDPTLHNLTFRLQTGYYAPPNQAVPLYNLIVFPAVFAPVNRWYFVAASYTPEETIALQVNSARNVTEALRLTAVVGPPHESRTDQFYLGPGAMKIGPAAIYMPDSLTNDELDYLYNGGAGRALTF